MLKSRVIAHCLVNLRTGFTLEQGEDIVYQTFRNEFPKERFEKWNTELPEEVALHIIKAVGEPSWIRVDGMIRDLW